MPEIQVPQPVWRTRQRIRHPTRINPVVHSAKHSSGPNPPEIKNLNTGKRCRPNQRSRRLSTNPITGNRKPPNSTRQPSRDKSRTTITELTCREIQLLKTTVGNEPSQSVSRAQRIAGQEQPPHHPRRRQRLDQPCENVRSHPGLHQIDGLGRTSRCH
jgi:hypothetical protein